MIDQDFEPFRWPDENLSASYHLVKLDNVLVSDLMRDGTTDALEGKLQSLHSCTWSQFHPVHLLLQIVRAPGPGRIPGALRGG